MKNPLLFPFTFGAALAVLCVLSGMILMGLAGCGGGDDDDDDDENDDVKRADKEEIICRKIEECGFTEDIGAGECASYAADMSEWLLSCAIAARGCGELADCFNLPYSN